MKKSIYIFLCLLASYFSFAQDPSGDFDRTIDSLKQELSKSTDDTIKVNILLQLVESISDDDVWPKYNEQMLQISEKIVQSKNIAIRRKGKKGLADAYNNIGFMHNNQGDIPNALDYFGKSLRMQEELGDKAGVAESMSNIGVIYFFQNELPKALDYYLKSLKIREAIGDKNGMANSMNNIGNLFYTQNNMPRALYYSTQSLKLQQEIGDSRAWRIR